ncbi:hypothetical protein [Algicola sagamiensis]|uniref:hypothetical protein n=1 Tax=Algicola sagamiensis TaxID=163869 RepID=UPI00037A74AF|nr:hypothetical protein [Algicola sagamiensis]
MLKLLSGGPIQFTARENALFLFHWRDIEDSILPETKDPDEGWYSKAIDVDVFAEVWMCSNNKAQKE